MKRRTFIASTLALGALPFGAIAGPDFVEYRPGLIQEELAAGKTVLVDYSAKWCSTCARQARVINGLRAQNADYDAKMVFVKVDWDTYRTHEVTKTRNVPRRSTLILLRGQDELGRIVAGTSESQIQSLLDQGL